MPHCWPQKQQCVFTSRSGSALVERRTPVMLDRCGPKPWMICTSLTGSVAMGSRRTCRRVAVSLVAPQGGLRQPEKSPTTTRTNLLVVVSGAGCRHLVRESELTLDRHEIAHHRGRGIGLSAAPTSRL